MSDFIVEAELREGTGRGAARRMRRAGKMPAVIYGGDKPELPITLDALSIGKLLDQETFYTSIVEINVKGSRGTNKGLVKDVQWHPVRDEAIHVDFHRVSASDIVHVEVPVNAIGFDQSPGNITGGILETIRHSLEVACRADSIPDAIDIFCAQLDIGDAVHVEDIALLTGVEIPHDMNFTVLSVAAPKIEAEPVEDEVEVTEGEAAEGEADSENEES
ncbi:MAG: 50S ribosomal protein L25/general stress protein Ctc [Mariprofundaceae bacterium]